MPKITATGPSWAEDAEQPADPIVVDEHGDDAAAVADAPAEPAPKPAAPKRSR